uniref:Uncharacterized protein n=1 Tax=Romanomermis culicivorax TaxID=13658 RepID=A0A915IGI3_ROMCU
MVLLSIQAAVTQFCEDGTEGLRIEVYTLIVTVSKTFCRWMARGPRALNSQLVTPDHIGRMLAFYEHTMKSTILMKNHSYLEPTLFKSTILMKNHSYLEPTLFGFPKIFKTHPQILGLPPAGRTSYSVTQEA